MNLMLALRLSERSALSVGGNVGVARHIAAAGFFAEIGAELCELDGF